jgi:error-prone DNA polymerase
MSGYVELHCHSAYSFLDGASRPEELASRAIELGYPALALTDHDGLYGSMEFARFARASGLQPITGAEVTLATPFADEDRGGGGNGEAEAGARAGAETDAPEYHVTLLAETPCGYANLCRLLTQAHMEGPRGEPRLPLGALLERSEGLILLSGCRRSPLQAALERSVREGEAFARRLLAAFGPRNLFIELMDNAVHGDRVRSRALASLADRLEIPVVATGNVHYHHRSRHRLQDVLVAIRNRTTVDDSHELRRPNACFHLASFEEMACRFESRPDAIANTLAIAERCADFDLTRDLGYEFPDFVGGDGAPAIRFLGEVCHAAFEERYPPGSEWREEAELRLERELVLVERHDLAGFFLVYRDILELAREVAHRVRGGDATPRAMLPPGRGRGSSVSSIICYLIGLSHVDPVQTNLYLGRFLNEAMGSVPDIDIDFARDIREELILAVYERYGSEHVGLVCTFPTYRTRSTVREIGKALGLPFGEIEKLAKLADPGSGGLKEELERLPEFREMARSPLWGALAELAEEIAGTPRHISQHVGGMVISSRPLVELVPLEPAAMEGRVLCQWDKDSCDDAGFIKIDFLALGMLSLVEEAVESIAVRHGEAPDLSRIDYEDEAIYDRICSGDTVGLFQVESRAQIQMLRRVRPRNLADLAIQVAIVRPGPIVGGAVNPYVRRRERLREDPKYRVRYDHPLLEDALGETLGVIIFQDQVLEVCKTLAGFSDGQAEGLRRAMSRKRSKEAMLDYWDVFRRGATANGVDDVTALKVFEQVVAFSEFGFPKSHAVAFGLLAYQSAWLRHYYPTEYYVALFNNQPMGFYSLDAIGRDARRNEIRILLPDLNRSRVKSTCEGDGLRVGLGFVRDWGTEVAEQVVAERDRDGQYRSLPDFLRRTPAALTRSAVENLIWVGGLDSLGLNRRELLWQAGLWLGPEPETEGERDGILLREGRSIRGRTSTDRADRAQAELELADPYASLSFAPTNPMEGLIAEYRVLSFATRLHPLTLVRDRLPAGTIPSGRFADLPAGALVQVAGIVVARQRPSTAKGFVFILMEDADGPVNVIVQPAVYERCRSAIRLEPFLFVRGELRKDGATFNVVARTVEALPLQQPWAPGVGPDLRTRTGTASDAAAKTATSNREDPFRYLTELRHHSPPALSWGGGRR